MIGEEKPSLEELAHFGVTGMRWKHRRVERQYSIPNGKPMPMPNLHRHTHTPVAQRGGKITDASQIVIPEGRRQHNAAIDTWLRDIKIQRMLLENGKEKTGNILDTVGDVPISDLPVTAQDNRA